ncbi:hypothetical protein AB3N04_01135 (plasmid) [Alkalihalophilus sp. As8PL]|uniref:Uncharacterized protein n=1 Tax=Alkalihalophilus sp. As8PL TaxID=3237103 RepID=A0AB39BNK2_9BACI
MDWRSRSLMKISIFLGLSTLWVLVCICSYIGLLRKRNRIKANGLPTIGAGLFSLIYTITLTGALDSQINNYQITYSILLLILISQLTIVAILYTTTRLFNKKNQENKKEFKVLLPIIGVIISLILSFVVKGQIGSESLKFIYYICIIPSIIFLISLFLGVSAGVNLARKKEKKDVITFGTGLTGMFLSLLIIWVW